MVKVSNVTSNNITALLRRPMRYRGVYSDVARELGLSRQFVARVAAGKGTSKRVLRALVRKLAALERVD
jgi:hypothetical protein